MTFRKICSMTAVLPEDSFHYADNGRTLLCRGTDRFAVEGEYDRAIFVRLCSESQDGSHPILESLRGKCVRVTIEVREDAAEGALEGVLRPSRFCRKFG
jgi:hypothetical protein